jgi:acyl-coenzyme A thioesterase PaaI-like protein
MRRKSLRYAQCVSHQPESSHEVSRTIDERANHCFGCGPLNPQGLHLEFTINAADPEAISASTIVELTRMHEGPPGYIHGGIIATLMDESMSKLNRPLQVIAMTRHMEVDYLRPAPLHTPLTLRSHHVRRDGRKIFHAAELMGPDGRVLARAKGFFIVIDQAMLERHAAGEIAGSGG